MRPVALAFSLLLATVAFGATRPDDAAVLTREDSFAEKTISRTYTLDLPSNGCVDLQFGGQITSGKIAWRLIDPSGKERMAVQTTRRASGKTQGIRSIAGKWKLTVEIENATGQSWVRWNR